MVVTRRLTLTVELAIAPGLHVYAGPVPPGLTPLSVDIEPIEGLTVGPVSWPAPRPLEIPELGEGVWVHEGTVRGTLPLTFTAVPGGGDRVLGVTVRYQACNDSSCLVPSSIRLQVPVQEQALVGRSLPSPATSRD